MLITLRSVVFLLLLLSCCRLCGQAPDTSARVKDSIQLADSIPPGFVAKMQRFAADISKKSAEERRADKAAILQDELFENIKKTIQRARTYLKNGIDTTGISEGLDNINHWHAIAGDGVFINKGRAQTYRNLSTTHKLLQVLEKRAAGYKAGLDNYQRRLSLFRFQIDSLGSDSAIYAFPADSLMLTRYLKKLSATLLEIKPVDTVLRKALNDVQGLQARANLAVYQISASMDEMEVYQRNIYHDVFGREFANLWAPAGADRPFSEIIRYSAAKGRLTFNFYVQDHLGYIVLLALLVLASAIYLRSLKKIYRQKNLLHADFTGQLVLRYPVLSALVIILNVFQFLFADPPFLLSAVFWTTSAVALTFIFSTYISRYWMRIWISLLVLFVLACADNLVLQASRLERWVILWLAMVGLVVSLVALFKGPRNMLREQWILYAIGFLALLELVSILNNCYGRYNLAKTVFASGYFNVVIAISFLWTVRLINEGLGLAAGVYAGQDRKLFYINYDKVGNRAPAFFYLFMVAGWCMLFGRNFYAFHLVLQPVQDFLSDERNIGDYTFTVNTLLLFVFILLMSVIISRVVSYFASDKYHSGLRHGQKDERAGIGSWLLLVRIAIISIGVLVAFSAAGIPMDKIAIILGALGVGIGFGLQTLVNNLVSGLIIAFEKPVNVGDVVEVDNQAGAMKSIGFRSSVIATWDGADMVIPNGDLLNSHLINWTLGGNKRRMNLVVGIAYDSDLEKTKELLKQIMDADDRILKYPAPAILFQDFNNSSIDVKLLFWVKQLKDGFPVRSDLIIAISKAFKDNSIVIPFPQQDIHIHTQPPSST